jgi:hypothetical protein
VTTIAPDSAHTAQTATFVQSRTAARASQERRRVADTERDAATPEARGGGVSFVRVAHISIDVSSRSWAIQVVPSRLVGTRTPHIWFG